MLNLDREFSFLQSELKNLKSNTNPKLYIKKELYLIMQCLLLDIKNESKTLIYIRTKKFYKSIQ